MLSRRLALLRIAFFLFENGDLSLAVLHGAGVLWPLHFRSKGRRRPGTFQHEGLFSFSAVEARAEKAESSQADALDSSSRGGKSGKKIRVNK